MAKIYFITHPEVVIDPNAPVSTWNLSDEGRRRLEILITQPWIKGIKKIFSSLENKAAEVAQEISKATDAQISYMEGLVEIDRRSTGFLGQDKFETAVQKFFESPDLTMKGWEKAIDAQARVIQAFEEIDKTVEPYYDSVICSHGAIGALLVSALKKEPISMIEMQPKLGCFFVYNRDLKIITQPWKGIDEL